MKASSVRHFARCAFLVLFAGSFVACGRGRKGDLAPVESEAAAPSDGARSIVILAGAGVEESIAQATATYVQRNWATRVRMARAESAETQPGPHDACLLILVREPAADPDPLDSVRIAGRKAVLNVAAFEKEGVMSPDKPEVFQRLVNKEAMRAIGLMLGMKPCPFPQCGLYKAENLAELQYKGQNYCPPCWEKSLEALKNNGLEYRPPSLKRPAKPESDAPSTP